MLLVAGVLLIQDTDIWYTKTMQVFMQDQKVEIDSEAATTGVL